MPSLMLPRSKVRKQRNLGEVAYLDVALSLEKGARRMKLTSKMLRRIIEEEASKFGKEEAPEDAAGDTEEVDADEFADSLQKKIDYEKAMQLEEKRLRRRFKKVREARVRVRKQIVKQL